MIEFSTQQVSADSKETLLALGILLCFALVAAGYVFKKGMEKGDRTTHELLLKCVIIITSVVPQQLPMQMALAVNTAMMALMKKGIFCTEPCVPLPNPGPRDAGVAAEPGAAIYPPLVLADAPHPRYTRACSSHLQVSGAVFWKSLALFVRQDRDTHHRPARPRRSALCQQGK